VPSIPHLLNGRDLLGAAQTGTGKTAAFTLPILQFLEEEKRPATPGLPSVLILAPTRELAAQIADSISAYGRHTQVKHTVIFGGVKQDPQVKALRRGVHIVVATPGRLLDLMQQKVLELSAVKIFVLDEADRMLDMGFLPDIRRIIRRLPKKRQSLLFSATLPDTIVRLSKQIVHDPIHVTIAPEQPAVEKIAQRVLFVEKKDKTSLLINEMKDHAKNKVLIFVQMKHQASRVARLLQSGGITATEIHGDRTQKARTQALEQFKDGRVRALVATDIAARGIDVEGISHVINYSVPQDAETYIHRIGRTARAGAEGDAVTFCCGEERDALRNIESLLKKDIPADVDHSLHSEAARTAVGVAARPPSKGGRLTSYTTRMPPRRMPRR